MKKSNIICALMALTAISANAQFRVQNDGKIAVHTTSTAQSPITINGTGNSNYYVSLTSSDGMNGVQLNTYGTGYGNDNIYGGWFNASSASQAVGLRTSSSNSNNCMGLIASAGCGVKTIGVLGTIQYGNVGAGVYGTSYGDFGNALTSGFYAGFFHGNVKVTGYIDGVLLGDESSTGSGSSVSSMSLRSTSVSKSLSGLSATIYQKERSALSLGSETAYSLDGDKRPRAEMTGTEPDIMDEQFYGKNHFALDADQLKETYPDLVYVRKDGSKAINYMEMIPLLVQSINELNAEIELLKSQKNELMVNASRTTTGRDDISFSRNVLYQNTPNPFKEQTSIRLSLADDTQSASICIFDMTGKMLKSLPVSTGDTSVSLNGWELGEGMFLYTLIVNGKEIDTRRMIITK